MPCYLRVILSTLLSNYGTNCDDVAAQLVDGILTVTGNDLDNVIAVGRDAAGNILVNGGTVSIRWGPATVSNTTLIRILGRGGADDLRIDDILGELTFSLP